MKFEGDGPEAKQRAAVTPEDEACYRATSCYLSPASHCAPLKAYTTILGPGALGPRRLECVLCSADSKMCADMSIFPVRSLIVS